jgi:hypothetical protein
MTGNHYPDGLTPEVITALQRAVDDELRREGYLVPQWPEPPWLPATPRRRPRRTRGQIRRGSGLAEGTRHASSHDTTGTSREAA